MFFFIYYPVNVLNEVKRIIVYFLSFYVTVYYFVFGYFLCLAFYFFLLSATIIINNSVNIILKRNYVITGGEE